MTTRVTVATSAAPQRARGITRTFPGDCVMSLAADLERAGWRPIVRTESRWTLASVTGRLATIARTN